MQVWLVQQVVAKLRFSNLNNTPGIVPEEPAVGVAQIIPIAALTSFVATAPLTSGTIPGVLFKLEKTHDITEDQMIDFLFTAALFGRVAGIVPEEPAVGVAQIIPIAALTSFVATAPLTASIISCHMTLQKIK
jgi:hypothetical protein